MLELKVELFFSGIRPCPLNPLIKDNLGAVGPFRDLGGSQAQIESHEMQGNKTYDMAGEQRYGLNDSCAASMKAL